jgi:hypothetical protein
VFKKSTIHVISTVFGFLVLIGITPVPTANAAAKPMPKVGSCYNLTKADVAADYLDIAPINCLKVHSTETYRVVKLKANDLAVNYDLEKAKKVCIPWKGSSKFLNYWAWYIPNPEQQKAGQNWIRCDGMIVKDYNESTGDYIITTWKGKRLDFR